jgi:deoxyribodipyrimidine photo-lyase
MKPLEKSPEDPQAFFQTFISTNLTAETQTGIQEFPGVSGAYIDRPWQDRPAPGTIRYMNDRGCARKFDVEAYTRRMSSL